jgi:SAM-dependent methyltransferase
MHAASVDGESHWNRTYQTKRPGEVSWYEPRPERSMQFIRRVCPPPAHVIDVGAGASTLVDALLEAGYVRPLALDISATALDESKARLGARSALVDWIVADITRATTLPAVDLWHDRALLHFLTDAADQRAYARLAAQTIRPGGHLVAATFAPDGPERCSGLPVQRHDGRSLASLLGPNFELQSEEREVHHTPSGAEQRFCWSILRRR